MGKASTCDLFDVRCYTELYVKKTGRGTVDDFPNDPKGRDLDREQ